MIVGLTPQDHNLGSEKVIPYNKTVSLQLLG